MILRWFTTLIISRLMQEDFGKWLREQRRKYGLTVEELAFRLWISRVTITRWELGQTKPTRAYRRMVEEFFRKLEEESHDKVVHT